MAVRSGEVEVGIFFHHAEALDLDVADTFGAEAVEADAVFGRLDRVSAAASRSAWRSDRFDGDFPERRNPAVLIRSFPTVYGGGRACTVKSPRD